MIARSLSALGLMKRSEHEARIATVMSSHDFWQSQAKDWHGKFKLAATDLAKQAREIAANKQDADRVQHMLDESEKLVSALTDKNVELIGKLATARGERDAAMIDAQKWRAYLKRSRDRRAGKAVKS